MINDYRNIRTIQNFREIKTCDSDLIDEINSLQHVVLRNTVKQYLDIKKIYKYDVGRIIIELQLGLFKVRSTLY